MTQTGLNGGLHTVSLGEVADQPWRNGGGSTRELLAWPVGGGAAAAWQCRISVATIAQGGPFSAFPGVERWFAVVRGEGVVLRFSSRRALLTSGSDPLRFEGAAAPGCELLDGPTQDLNLMVRHDAGKGAMLRALPGADWLSTAPLRAVFTMTPATLRIDGTEAARLPAGTLAWSEAAASQRWCLQPPAAPDAEAPAAWWLQLKPFPR